MGFTFKGVRLPFLRVNTSKTGKTSVVWKLGPLQRNSRTGQTTIRLGKRVKWTGKTKSQKQKTRSTRTVARMNERAKWDAQFAAAEAARRKDSKAGASGRRTTGTASSKTSSTGRKTSSTGTTRTQPPEVGTGLPVGSVLTLRPGPTQATWQRQADGMWRNPTSGATVTAEQMQGHLSAGEPYEAALPDHLTHGDPGRLSLQEAEAELAVARAQTHRTAVAAGLCGAPTRDGSSCLNPAGSCPHHEPAPRL